jgi:membrane associated rhomboid family serine protease
MYRPRRRRDLGSSLTFGGRIPAAAGLLLVLLLAGTLLDWVAPSTREWVALDSGTLVRGQWWRLVTWPWILGDPMNLIFGGLAVWFFAPPLIFAVGERRFLADQLITILGAGLVTLLLGWLLGRDVRVLGLWPLVNGLVLSWALRYPDQQVLIYFVLPVSGRVMGLITVGVNALFLLFALARQGLGGVLGLAPALAALGFAWVLTRGGLRLPLRRWRLGLRDWQLERRHRRRARHLQVVRKDGQGPNQWLN